MFIKIQYKNVTIIKIIKYQYPDNNEGYILINFSPQKNLLKKDKKVNNQHFGISNSTKTPSKKL